MTTPSSPGAPGAPPPPAVLVVEDEALVAMLVADILAEAGHRPAWTPDGRFGPADPAAAVVDLRLADGLDGRDVVRRLRAHRPALPVVVVTGYLPDAPQADLRGLGGPTLRLCKPFDCDELAASLSAVMAVPATHLAAAPRRRQSDHSEVPA
ncbi:MAG: response regulator transcription factor [Acetobacteraceae bacterium]|nr:response regulator transcription factor [Acetobacteraceae bacterium]